MFLFFPPSGVDFSNIRIPGVLQRFSGTYLIVSTVFLLLAPPNHPNQVIALILFNLFDTETVSYNIFFFNSLKYKIPILSDYFVLP